MFHCFSFFLSGIGISLGLILVISLSFFWRAWRCFFLFAKRKCFFSRVILASTISFLHESVRKKQSQVNKLLHKRFTYVFICRTLCPFFFVKISIKVNVSQTSKARHIYVGYFDYFGSGINQFCLSASTTMPNLTKYDMSFDFSSSCYSRSISE